MGQSRSYRTLIVVLVSENGELKKKVIRFMMVSVTYFSNIRSVWNLSTVLHTCGTNQRTEKIKINSFTRDTCVTDVKVLLGRIAYFFNFG